MITIIGGGIIGLSIGWRLCQAGQPATVIERGAVGRGASWAAAGILTRRAEQSAFARLGQASHALWPDFAAELSEASGLDLDYRRDGALTVARRHQVDALRDAYERARALGWPVKWLDGEAAREREPHLAEAVTGAIFDPLTHQVDNRHVMQALERAFVRAGGMLMEQRAVQKIEIAGDAVRAIRVDGMRIPIQTVIVAAGAWTGQIAGLSTALRLPVRPIKGQMAAVQMPPSAPLITQMVRRPMGSLVPRRDGRLIIGTTEEDAGFDGSVTPRAVIDLLEDATAVLPGILDLPLIETWSGLRPGTPDGDPILGATAIAGLYLATGHQANGILLAPITAQALSHLLVHGEQPEIIQLFGIERFAARV